ncbi:ankyrin repeat, bromo and BTB domain-containing protein DDB_G0293800-like [Schistocerca gregaria]|uniref:ankyrin repeat, bromo and BTB domain-containing protein DDB_G0293800-like n=1 Tax=Schistocerca gregaria TaxID=7010 RepID=UPI00211F4457|nr:ankyrin repeat, bromo and BTB domain-containing protein DDB_G0293800-like [Schistocerca gregaria]
MCLCDEAQRGNFAAVAELINRGANLSQQGANGEYPLHAAVKSSNKSIVSLLIEKGCKVNCANASGLTPLHYAARKGDLGIFLLLLSHAAREDARDVYLWTPLHYACYHGHAQIVEHLLKMAPALANEADAMGHTPLYLACKYGHLEVVEKLLEAGAKFLIKDSADFTPFSYLPSIKVERKYALDREPANASYVALSNDLRSLFESPLYSDVTFLVEALPEPNEDGLVVTEEVTVHTIPAHRAILQCRCPLILQEAPPFRTVSGGEIKVSGMTYSLFRAILEFVYSGAITFKNGEIDLDFAFNLAKKGEEYKIPSLMHFSEGLILANLDEETVISVLEVATSYGCCPHLEYYCRYYILKNFDKIIAINPDIQNFTAEHLCPIFKQISVIDPPVVSNYIEAPPELSPTLSPLQSSMPPLVDKAPCADYKPSPVPHAPQAFPYFNKPVDSKPVQDPNVYLKSPPAHAFLPPAVSAPPAGSDYLSGKLLDFVKRVHKGIMREHDALDFNSPVEYVLLGLPEYPEIVRRPMDLGTVQKSLNSGAYKLLRNWAEDVRLVWDNARIYNTPESLIYKYAERLSNLFESQYAQLQKQFDLPPNYDVHYPKPPEWYINTYNKNLNNYRLKLGLAPIAPSSDLPPSDPPKYPKAPPSQKKKLSPVSINKKRKSNPPIDSVKQPPPDLQPPLVYQNNVKPFTTPISQEEMEEISRMLVELDESQSAKLIRILDIQPNADGEYEISIDSLDSNSIRKMLDFLYQELGTLQPKKKKTDDRHLAV